MGMRTMVLVFCLVSGCAGGGLEKQEIPPAVQAIEPRCSWSFAGDVSDCTAWLISEGAGHRFSADLRDGSTRLSFGPVKLTGATIPLNWIVVKSEWSSCEVWDGTLEIFASAERWSFSGAATCGSEQVAFEARGTKPELVDWD